ncbi:MAG: hypothetical protein QXM76_01875 [Zestosphaera sp.]
MSSPAHEVVVEMVFEPDECLISNAVCKSLAPEAKLTLKGVTLQIKCDECGFKIIASSQDASALMPPVVKSLKLTSSLIETLKALEIALPSQA